MAFESTGGGQDGDGGELPAVNMAEAPDGVFVVFIPGVPHPFEVHVGAQVDHPEGPGGGTEIKEAGIGRIHHGFHEIGFAWFLCLGVYCCQHGEAKCEGKESHL